ncbi:MAG: glycosyltransferase [Clostridia bacterium]|nr:glycosyltransferase [Clostridia bacterium]
MKKQLLFIIPRLCIGGAEKSLISLLRLLDYSAYDVDLLLFRKEGEFLADVPKQVSITDAGEEYIRFDGSAVQYIKGCIKKLRISDIINRTVYSKAVGSGDYAKSWSCLKKTMTAPKKHYDTAIAYLEDTATYYCADCVSADKKIAYVHCDYRKLVNRPDFDREYYKKFDRIVTISDECLASLAEVFPEYKDKLTVIENITSEKTVKHFAEKPIDDFEADGAKKILTVGRLAPPKGHDMAVEAAKILSDKGYDFKWFALGSGDLEQQIKEQVKSLGLEDKFILLGAKANPYPYFDGCDIYVQTSYSEGKSIAIDEAKIFAKPIVCTSFPTVYDQLTDGKTALLAEINAESIAEKIEILLNDDSLCKALSENLKKEKAGNEEEIDKFYQLPECKI